MFDHYRTHRTQAARALGELGPVSVLALDGLASMMESGDLRSKLTAIDAVGKLGPPAARMAPRLRQAAESDEFRQHANRALRRLGL